MVALAVMMIIVIMVVVVAMLTCVVIFVVLVGWSRSSLVAFYIPRQWLTQGATFR